MPCVKRHVVEYLCNSEREPEKCPYYVHSSWRRHGCEWERMGHCGNVQAISHATDEPVGYVEDPRD